MPFFRNFLVIVSVLSRFRRISEYEVYLLSFVRILLVQTHLKTMNSSAVIRVVLGWNWLRVGLSLSSFRWF